MDNLILIKSFILPDLFFEIYLMTKGNNDFSISKIREIITIFFKNRDVYISDLIFKENKLMLHVDCYNEVIDRDNLVLYIKNNIDFTIVEKIIIS